MRFQTRYLVYILLLHALLGWLLFTELRQEKPLFASKEVLLIAVEVLIILSLYTAFSIYRAFRRPSAFIASGIEAIRDKDFTIKFVPTGNSEVDELIRVYNLMIDQLRQERTRQAEQQFFLDKLIDASPIALLIFDFDARVAGINPKARQLLKCPEADLLGKPLSAIDHPLLNQLDTLPLDQPQIVRLTGVETYRVLRGQFIDRGFGRQFLFIEELTAEIIDTEKKAYGKVIRMMAHEVNNSIGAVNTILSIVEPTVGEADLQRAMRVAIERNERLNGFMRRFADVVRLPVPHRVRADMAALVQNIARLMAPQAEGRAVTLQVTTPDEPVWWLMDESQLEQVLINVVKNALESCRAGNTVSLELSAQQLLIRNNGDPIPDEVAGQLFNPFYSTKRDGQGIGLTLTREILLNHGFAFSLLTEPTGETVFRILNV
ncbi:Alginate biosynthesis sensor protein kinB [Fibrella aestuarina BUZ 2]|uniref:histidine kinase n=1 Tax=Fibrella aestuarina BUZ 2 TaxID=1166018 RepID=I0KBC5_9BACT|nr:ATP-binding protein [Fibrella aestuarina]CCH01428.1 Alginate biosynthesis sensor protein kinB [Fibrella aestuarina BUZ 2]